MSFRFFVVLAMAAAFALAQEPAPQPSSEPQTQEDAATAPSDTVDVASQPSDTYSGPSILSREHATIGERGGKLLDFRLFASLDAVYDSFLTPVSVNNEGALAQTGGSYGIDGSIGLNGSKQWRHNKIWADYRGTWRHYVNRSYFDGSDQFLDLAYERDINRHWIFQARETGGIVSLANGAFNYYPLTNTDLFAVPSNELFDNRLFFSQSRADFIFQKSLRTSYSFGGEGFTVSRRSSSLASVHGGNAHGDYAYRLTKHQTLSVSYAFTQFAYDGFFGDSSIHSLSAGYSAGLGRRWDFSSQFGVIRLEARGLKTVTLDPAIAAIVGTPTTVAAFDTTRTIPLMMGRLLRRFEKSMLTVTAANMFSPGNGVYLTSQMKTVAAQYSYVGLRRTSFSATAGYSSLQTIGQGLSDYSGEIAGVGMTHRLTSSTFIEARYDYRHFATGAENFRKNSSRVSLGIAYSPGERPLSIW